MPLNDERLAFDAKDPILANLGVDEVARDSIQADALLCLLIDGLAEIDIDQDKAFSMANSTPWLRPCCSVGCGGVWGTFCLRPRMMFVSFHENRMFSIWPYPWQTLKAMVGSQGWGACLFDSHALSSRQR